jgi:hypothetical protein
VKSLQGHLSAWDNREREKKEGGREREGGRRGREEREGGEKKKRNRLERGKEKE